MSFSSKLTSLICLIALFSQVRILRSTQSLTYSLCHSPTLSCINRFSARFLFLQQLVRISKPLLMHLLRVESTIAPVGLLMAQFRTSLRLWILPGEELRSWSDRAPKWCNGSILLLLFH
jgi:hypothetical protein